jgi:uncharacterized protein YlbG (UPF0298 family)
MKQLTQRADMLYHSQPNQTNMLYVSEDDIKGEIASSDNKKAIFTVSEQ